MMGTRLNITYSAYRELETIPQSPLRDIGEAIISLAEDPHPPGATNLKGIGGCYYLAIDDYYILYHLDDEGLTVLGVLHGPYHPLHLRPAALVARPARPGRVDPRGGA